MTRRSALPVVLLALGLAPSQAASQLVPVMGDRVRLRVVDSSRRVIGTVQSISSAGISILDDGDDGEDASFFLAQRVRELEVSRGQSIREGRPALAVLSFFAAVGAGAGVGAALWTPCTEEPGPLGFGCFKPGSRRNAALLGALVFGLPVGGSLAYFIERDRRNEIWESAALPARTQPVSARVFGGVSGRGLTLGLSVPMGGR